MAGKQPEFKTKKLYYRRGKWDKQGKKTLEALLKDAHDQLDTVGKRTFSASAGVEIRGADVKHNKGLYLHIASYVPGESTSIIDKDLKAKQSAVSAQGAPTGKDFIDGDIFVLIKGNHLILCPSGVRESVARAYIWNVLTEVNEHHIAEQFELDKIAKTSKVRMIKDEGVDEIVLGSSLYDASLIRIDSSVGTISTA